MTAPETAQGARRRRPDRGQVIAGSAVAGLALVAVVGTLVAAPSPAATAGPQALPVTGTVRICPSLSPPAAGRTVLAAALPPTATGSGATTPAGSTLAVRRLADPSGAPVAALPAAGTVSATFAAAAGPGLVAGAGPGAAAAAVVQAGRADAGAGRGLALAACGDPTNDQWFIGAATTVGATSQLLLGNPDTAPAVVDVSLLTPDGSVVTNAGSGLPVAPGTQVTLPLDVLSPQSALLAVHVQARAGRVTGALQVSRANLAQPLGTDWLPPAAAPATTAYVPGLPGGSGQRQVLVGNPGTDPATVALRLVTDQASFVPQGLQAVSVPAGTAVAVDVTAALAGRPGTAVVTADAPVVAGAASLSGTGAGTDPTDEAWSAATPLLRAPVVVPDIGLAAPAEQQVVLTAPDGSAAAATVAVGVLAADGTLTPLAPVAVPAGRSVVLARPAAATAGTALVLQPGASGGGVVAALVVLTAPIGTTAGLLSVLPLTGRSPVVLAPPVAADLFVGVGSGATASASPPPSPSASPSPGMPSGGPTGAPASPPPGGSSGPSPGGSPAATSGGPSPSG